MGKHMVCANGVLTEQACPMDQGCDAATGKCASCVCKPGDPATCLDANTAQTCDPSCTALVSTPCDPGKLCIAGACAPAVCSPGTKNCTNDTTFETCNAGGSGYDPGGSCTFKEKCVGSQGCKSLCDILAGAPSSVGCSFFGLNMWNFNDSNPDAIVVGNANDNAPASVTMFTKNGGVETVVEGPVPIPPNGLHIFYIPNAASDVITGSALRSGGAFRVESDVPIVAYLHSPVQPQATNDASCLLPEPTLGNSYVVASYIDGLGGYPSYFDVIGTVDGTQVTVTSSTATDSGPGAPALTAGQTATYTLNRYDTLQIAATGKDVMGTVVKSNQPVSVIGAVQCADVPQGVTYCDHLEEQMIPTRNWGKTYVGAHAPTRGNESYYWRILAQQDGTVVDTTPQQPGFPKTLGANQWYEFNTKQSFIFTGNKPYMAYQYLAGTDGGANDGDPAMMTSVPVEQFLDHYVILTPSGYTSDYVQIIRAANVDVTVDGAVVPAAEYYTLGAYQVADHKVTAGTHVMKSAMPFGIMGIGYTAVTSYGYPGGMALVNINP